MNTPQEQWSDACRKELLRKLKRADEEFFRKRRFLTEREIALNNGNINIPENKLLSLKWNHEEFFIEYEVKINRHLLTIIFKFFILISTGN